MQQKKAAAYRQGITVLLALAILTILEFIISGATNGSAPLLFIIALIKTGLIANYFMHIYRLWREESH